MAPIFDKLSVGNNCPCDEQVKFYFWLIDPINYGYSDMSNWSINGVDFIIGVNTEMQTYGPGSGIAVYMGYWNFGPFQQGQKGWLAYYGKYSDLPKPLVKDPMGNIIDASWAPLYGGFGAMCDQGWADFPNCVHYTVPKVNPFIRYVEIYWFDQFQWNANTGYGSSEGVPSFYIDFNGQYGGDIDLISDPAAASKIKTVLDGMYLNGTNCTISAAGPNHYDVFISKVFYIRSGFYNVDTNKWQDGERDTVNCI